MTHYLLLTFGGEIIMPLLGVITMWRAAPGAMSRPTAPCARPCILKTKSNTLFQISINGGFMMQSVSLCQQGQILGKSCGNCKKKSVESEMCLIENILIMSKSKKMKYTELLMHS